MQILSASHKTKEVEDFERMLKRYVPILLAALLLLSVSCSNDTSPPQTENPGGGSSHHTGNTISTGAQFLAALASSGTYSVTEDITVTTENSASYRIRNQDIVIDLGGHTVTSDVLLEVYGTSLTLKNGTIYFHNTKNMPGYAFYLFSQGKLALDGITMTSEFGGIVIKNGVNAVNLDITNKSNVVSKGGFTIAYEEKNEQDATSVVINITDSNITAVDENGSQKYNTTAFLINCSATVNVSDSTFKGDRQAYVARAGDHILKNTKLCVTGKYTEKYIENIKGLGSSFESTLWYDSNDVPNGGLIIGGNNLSYQFPVTVKVVDESVEILMEDVNDSGYYGFFGTIVMHTEESVEMHPHLGIEPYEAVDVYLHGRPTIKVGRETTKLYCCISNIPSNNYW